MLTLERIVFEHSFDLRNHADCIHTNHSAFHLVEKPLTSINLLIRLYLESYNIYFFATYFTIFVVKIDTRIIHLITNNQMLYTYKMQHSKLLASR